MVCGRTLIILLLIAVTLLERETAAEESSKAVVYRGKGSNPKKHSKHRLTALLDKIPGFFKFRTCATQQKTRVMKKEVKIGLRCSVLVVAGFEAVLGCLGRKNIGLVVGTSTRILTCLVF